MTPLPEDEPATGTRGSSLMPVGKSVVPDRLYDLNLKRLMELANERTLRELGPLPPGGVPVATKRKAPHLAPGWRHADSATQLNQENPDMKLTPVAAAAALALSACAQPFVEHYPKTPPPPPLSAQATPTPPPSMTPEEAASAAQVNDMAQRVLRLIDKLPSIADLTRQQVEGELGVNLVKRDSWHTYVNTGFGGYAVMFDEIGPSLNFPRVMVSVGSTGGNYTMPTPLCLEFEPYAAALLARGFSHQPHVGSHGELLGWDFSRLGDRERRPPVIAITTLPEVLKPAGERGGRNCINWIEIW